MPTLKPKKATPAQLARAAIFSRPSQALPNVDAQLLKDVRQPQRAPVRSLLERVEVLEERTYNVDQLVRGLQNRCAHLEHALSRITETLVQHHAHKHLGDIAVKYRKVS